MVRVLTEHELRRVVDMDLAIKAIEEVLRERVNGSAISLPHARMEIGEGRLVFTTGGFPRVGALGFRVYPAGYPAGDQLVAVWDTNGRLVALMTGGLLGAIRTGAIGGVAIKWLSRPDASVVGVVGAGQQAYTQLMAAVRVREIREVRICRRRSELLKEQAQEWSKNLGVEIRRAYSPKEAIDGADIVIIATTSSEPVISADWLARGVHVNSLGPKYRGRSEIGLDLVSKADLLVSDFPEPYRDEKEFMLNGTSYLDQIQDLSQLIDGRFARTRQATTLFLSHGLAGTEVLVALEFARRARELGIGLEIEAS